MTPRPIQLAIMGFVSLVAASFGQIPEDVAGESVEADNSPSIGRIVRHFDFEERGFNALDIPLYWIRAQHDPEVRDRPGFPITNLGRLDYKAPTTSGFGVVRLDTTGGSTSLRLEPGVATTFPSVKYAVGAMVRVEGLTHARPRLAARLLDEEGRPIDGTSAQAVVHPDVNGWSDGFVPVLIKLPSAPAQAVSLQIDLELVQPQEFARQGERAYELWSEDYAGTVWFDDVVIVQLPTASLATTRQSNTFVADESPELLVAVRDLSGDPIDLELRVRDIDGVVVAERSDQFGAGAREIRWRPDLERLGWYEAELLLRVGSIPMLRLRERFVWLPGVSGAHLALPVSDGIAPDRVALSALSDRRRLAMVVPPHDDEPLTSAAREAFERSGSRTLLVTVPVSGSGGPETQGWSELARTFTSLRSRLGAQSTVVLDVAAHEDDEAVGRSSRGDLALAAFDDGALWDDVLVPLIDRLAEGVTRWHVGPIGSDALAATPSSANTLKRIGERLHRLAPDPMMGAPWWGEFDPAAAMLPDGRSQRRSGGTIEWSLTVRAPQEASGDWIEEATGKIAALLASGSASEGVLVLEPLDESLFGRHAAVARLAEQMLAFWSALPQPEFPPLGATPASELRLALTDGFRWKAENEHEDPAGTGEHYHPIEASAQLAAWRAIGDRLVGRRRVHRFETADGVEASVYHAVVPRTAGSGGLLVLHPPSTQGHDGHTPSVFEFYLGEEPVRVFDVFGNEHVVEAIEAHDAASDVPRLVHRIELGDWPVFVEGVDVDLLLFIASLRLEPGRLPAIDTEHQAALVMRNPWPGVTSVRVRVVSPGGFGGQPVTQRSWEISPRLTELLLEGGVERRTPINIRFRRSEPAGRKNLGLELDIRGEQAARRVRVDVPFEIGLEYLSVVASARRTPEGLLVQAEVRNLGDRPITLEVTAIAQGARRERAIIARLPAGATARRDILIRAANGVDRVLLAVEDTDVGGRLNYEVEVP
ncbi:MAG: hypothetical protein RIE77_10130 [Phycisphaerales bacterium]|jgi:hypothetical protein